MKSIIASIILVASGSVSANGWWVNIPGHDSPITDRYVPATSYYAGDYNTCRKAMVEYIKDNFTNYIGCDVVPLRDAVNVRNSFKK